MTRTLSMTTMFLLFAAQGASAMSFTVRPATRTAGLPAWHSMIRPFVVALAAADQAASGPSAAKTAEVKSAAAELAAAKIRVNTLNPGPIDNRMMSSIEEQGSPEEPGAVHAMFESRVPMGRYGTNEEMAKIALFLASDDSSYCTGTSFVGDGGYVSQ